MSDELTELPEGWAWVTAETVCQIISGFAFKSVDFCAEGIPAIKIANISYGDFLWKQQEYLPISFLEKYSEFQVAPKNFLIALTRPITNNAVKVCLYPKDAPVGLLNQRVALIKPNSSYSQKLLLFFSQSDFFREQVQSNLSETLQPNLSPQALKQFFVPLPPLNEQKRIVAKIEELRDRHQRAKQALETIPELCDRFRQSVLAAAFRGDLTADWREQNPDVEPASVLLERIRGDRSLSSEKSRSKEPDSSQLLQIPETWLWVALEEIATHKSGIAFKSSEFTNDGIQVIRLGNVYKGSLNLNRDPVFLPADYLASNFSLSAGDIVVSQTGTRFKRDYGNFVLIPNGCPKLLLNQRLLAIFCHSLINPEYVVFASKLKVYQDHFFSHETGGVNQGNVGVSGVMKGLILLAPEQEAKILLTRLKEAFEYILKIEDACQRNKTCLETLNQSILAQAFRGELVEQDPNDEPASVLLDRIRAEREKTQASKSTKGWGRGSKASKDASEQMTLPDAE